MTLETVAGLLILSIFVLLIVVYATVGRRWPAVFRSLPAFEMIGRAVEESVEAGEVVHLSLGTGTITGADIAPALAGLSVLSGVAKATVAADRPMVATAGDGALMILAQDTLHSAYARAEARHNYSHLSARLLGPSPYAYAAGVPSVLADEGASVHLLLGAFGAEGALTADFGERRRAYVVGGSNDIRTQAMMYAITEHALIGEEIYAGGSYLNVGGLHKESLRAQDVMRVVLVAVMLMGALLRTLGVLP